MPTGTIVLNPNPISAADIVASLQAAGCRCTNSLGCYQTYPTAQGLAAQCQSCSTATIVTPGISGGGNLPNFQASGTGVIPSAHGGKPIPVVPSHSAIAAAKANATAQEARALTYKDHILVGVREDDGSTKVVCHWAHLPTQAEIDGAISGAQFRYASFALCNPVNVWSAK